MEERPPHGTVPSPRHLDFEGPCTVGRADLPTPVQPSRTSASNQTDLIDITEGTEQVPARNPPPLEFEIRAASIQVIQLIRHLTAMIKQSDALNKCNHNELNLLQQKVEEKDQIIVQKDGIIAERDGTVNSHLSMIATLIAQLFELHLVRSQQQINEIQSYQHFEEALNALVADLSYAIVDPTITPPRPPSRQPTLSLLNYLGGHSRSSTPDSQDSLSFRSRTHGIPTT